jgi:diguanylate cyclase (GGDEF)-like protein
LRAGGSNLLDFTSLLLAVGFSGVCLSATLLGVWTSARRDSFLLTWASGVMLLVGHVLAYWTYVQSPSISLLSVVLWLLAVGLAMLYGAAHQFCTRRSPLGPSLLAAIPVILLEATLLLAGYDGAAMVVENAGALVVLGLTASIYFRHRRDAPIPMVALALMYAACGVSFGLCGMMLVVGREWVIGHAPKNWAEDLSIMVAVASMTGIGALSLGLNQARNAARHRVASLIDPLTGAMNRRALFDRYGDRPFGAFMAIVMFDLDHFKGINDTYGHALGDEVLRRFAEVARRHLRSSDDLVRLGGEEFALLMPRVTEEDAQGLARLICGEFAACSFATETGTLSCTVSAGIGFGRAEGAKLEEVLHRADAALYAAKRGGRNRIEFKKWRLVG